MELIDKQYALASAISGIVITDENGEEWIRRREVRESIMNAPTIDAEPVKHGRWIRRKTVTHHGELYCSICEEESPIQMLWRYCPSCGAKMDLTE